MKFISEEHLNALLSPLAVIETLDQAFRSDIEAPNRHHHSIRRTAGEIATLLLMPAWDASVSEANEHHIGVKVVSVFPQNQARNARTINGIYLLLAGHTGEMQAIIDGPSLTVWRTAAASALASRYLSREDSHRLTMIGTGALAPYLIRAHVAARPIKDVLIWGRDRSKAARLAAELSTAPDLQAVSIKSADSLEAAIRHGDIVSAATLSTTPLIEGRWLAPGSHVDLVGGFTPHMREADDEAIRVARIFVDTKPGAMREAGDLVQPLADGLIDDTAILGDLFELCRGGSSRRSTRSEITLFKSVGTAIQDLAVAAFAYRLSDRHAVGSRF